MKTLFIAATVSILFVTGASAQFTTECQRDHYGGVTCDTYPSNGGGTFNPYTSPITPQELRGYGGIDTTLFDSIERSRLANEQIRRQQRNEAQAAPEWQLGGLVSRVEGKSQPGTSMCVYQTATGRTWLQGKAYDGGFSVLVSRTAQCPQKMSISKTTGERK
jgi:hypothetical protein